MKHLLFLAAALVLPFAALAAQPDIILIMGDDHGWEETGYNGHPHVKTPVLDEMAASGLKFGRFYAHPVCSPTRASFLTGRDPNRMGVFAPGWSLRPEEVTIAHLLAKAGYHCAHLGKWHVGAIKAGSPLNPGAMGFHEWLSHDNFFEMNPSFSRNGGPPEVFKGESSEILIREAIAAIRRAREAAKPAFLVIWFGSPHEPYSGLPQDLAGEVYEGGTLVPAVLEWPARIPKPRATDVRATTSDLLPTLAAISGQPLPKRPLDGIDLAPLFDGTMTARPVAIGCWTFDTKRLKTLKLKPYIDPELQKGTTPLVKLAGGKATRDFTNFRHPAITAADYRGARSLIDGDHKIVIREKETGQSVELFDLKNDPAEKTNLAGERPELAEKLQTKLRKWQDSVLKSLTGADYGKPSNTLSP